MFCPAGSRSRLYCSPARCTPGSTTANATTKSYKSHKYQSDLIQHATVGPFAPNTEVSYSIANGAFANTFKTPPLSKTYPQHVVVVGDLGQTENSVNTLNAMEQSACGQPSVVFHVGDLSYADGDRLLRFARVGHADGLPMSAYNLGHPSARRLLVPETSARRLCLHQ
ncbi:acid phosphatase type 7 [Pseudoscourfieldia marina]